MELKPTDVPASTPESSPQPAGPTPEMACSTQGKCSTACCPISRATRWAVGIVALLVLIQSGALIADYVPFALAGGEGGCPMSRAASAMGKCSKPQKAGSESTQGDSPVIAAIMECPSKLAGTQPLSQPNTSPIATLAAADVTAAKPGFSGRPLTQASDTTPDATPAPAQPKEACESNAGSQSKEQLAAVRLSATLPEISYLVAGDSFDCAMAAAMHSDKTKKPVEYVVNRKLYPSAAHAKVAQLEATEAMLAKYTQSKPHLCNESGKLLSHDVGSLSLSCEKTAAAAAIAAKAAAEGVVITYLVAGQPETCPRTAAAHAERTGNAVYYVVQGEATRCKLTGNLQLARARMFAAAQAAQRAALQPVNTPKAEPAGDTPVSEPAPAPQADPAAARASVAG
jgi:hypothetical protein